MKTAAVVVSTVMGLVLSACGGEAACSKDSDCKGARVCRAGECVDTTSTGGGNAGFGAGSAGAGSAGAGSSGGASGGSCDKDTDCPSGAWCNQGTCQPTTRKRVGEQCVTRDECAGTTCLYRTSGDVSGYCSKQCDSFTECPTFWKCEDIANGAGKRCVQ
jgi:hypothetical protein